MDIKLNIFIYIYTYYTKIQSWTRAGAGPCNACRESYLSWRTQQKPWWRTAIIKLLLHHCGADLRRCAGCRYDKSLQIFINIQYKDNIHIFVDIIRNGTQTKKYRKIHTTSGHNMT